MNFSIKTSFSTLLELLQYRARVTPETENETAFTFLEDGDQVSESITFADLDWRSRSIASHLQQHARPGDRVLLVYPPGIDYIAAFFGCVYAGVIAVPALPPANARTLPRLQLIAEDAQPALAMTLQNIAARIDGYPAGQNNPLQSLLWLSSDALPDTGANWVQPHANPADTVFLQYTSGSTAAPKGVMVSHANILANVGLIHARFGIRQSEVVVSWLPPHHDMGLIGKILYPVFVGCHCVQFPPVAFLMRPLRWLKALSDYRARITAAPNFAYELCISKIDEQQKQGLDLSALEFALNGAEPIRPNTMRRFAQAFAASGFRAEAMTPVYGLAEATLLVSANTGKQAGKVPATLTVSKAALAQDRIEICEPDEESMEVTSCGECGPNQHQALIVDAATLCRQADGRVGEVWVSGASVATGYWRNEPASAQTFGHGMPGSSERCMRTGDLGFMHQNQLYIVGRIKEMMIVNGRNLYPQDVETTVELVDPAFRTNGCAVFFQEQDQVAGLVVIVEVEVRRQAVLDGLPNRVRASVAEQHDVFDVAAIVLVRAGHIPRTSSGKIQRLHCRELFNGNGFSPLWSWRNQRARGNGAAAAEHVAAQTDTERKLVQIWEELLDLAPISVTADFFALGGHSLLATQMVSQLRTVFQIELPLQTLFDTPVLTDLARWLDDGAFVGVKVPAITKIDRGSQALELSFSQQRLWFLDQFHPGGSAYNIAAAMRLRGRFDQGILRAILNDVVQRHEALRTVFASVDGTARQIVLPELQLTLPVVDLCAETDGAVREQLAHRLTAQEAAIPFNLATGPLIRARLLKLAEQEHILLFTLHHIVSDGWSMGVLAREVALLYEAHVGGQGAPLPALPALPVQYADFAHWQRQRLRGEMLDTQLAYWKKHLADAPTLLALPTDRPRPSVQTHASKSHHFVIPEATATALQALNRQARSTLFMTLASTFNVLLARYSGQTDICIGTPIANRNVHEIEALIGFFVNTLVLRTRLEGNPTFRALLRQVRANALAAYAHQDIPFEQLVETLKPERHASHAPLFQVMLVLQNMPMQALTLPGLTIEPLRVESTSAIFDLTLEIVEQNNQLQAFLEYNSDLFNADTIERMSVHFVSLLDAIAANPDCPVQELVFLSEQDQIQLLSTWNDTVTPYPEMSIQQLIEAQVIRTPDKAAIQFGSRTLTYREMNARANQLARHLRELGVGPETLVGICVERSLEMVIGLLGILKAGGAYVPLDPANPPDRLAYILDDACPKILLTQQALLEKMPARQHVMCLDGEDDILAQHGQDNPAHITLPDHLAYIIYTSGSTGKPKGTLNTHRNVVNHTFAYIKYTHLNQDDRMIQFASINFDASVEELFHSISIGATMVIRPVEFMGAGAEFSNWVEQQRISLLNLPTSLWQEWVHALEERSAHLPSCVRAVVLGGEKVQAETYRRWQEQPERQAVLWINSYGPTEATITASSFTGDANTVSRYAEIPIGRPLMNYSIYLLDPQLNPVPIGVSGELHIAGDGLARGYHRQPDLTADKFIPDPFSRVPGARMYKSGDLACHLTDGNIEYRGRIDHQFKIRGYRIEPGEIEAALTALPQVRDAIVLVREDVPGNQQLVAYLVPAMTTSMPSSAELRQDLSQNLPEYMIPTHFIALPAFPLNVNDKIDRKALPAPDLSQTSENFVAPGTATEHKLALIWTNILKLDKIGIHDDFFALGGHSLLALQMVSRITQAFAITLPLDLLFGMKNIHLIAAYIDSLKTLNTSAPRGKEPAAGISRIRL